MNGKLFGAIWLAALTFRLINVHYSPVELGGDELEYAATGKHIRFDQQFSMGDYRAWGHPPSDSSHGRLIPSAFRAPMFPLVFAGLWGSDPGIPPTRRVQFFNAICGASSATIAASIAGSPIAGVITACWPLLIQSDSDPLSEALFELLMLLGIWLWQKNRFILAGLVLGLAALTRVSLFPCLILFLILSPIRMLRRKQFALVSIVGLLVVAPWTIRNAVVLHKLIPVAVAGSGSNLLLGTIFVPPFSGSSLYGEYAKDPEFYAISHDATKTAEESEEKMREVGMKRIIDHPLRWLGIRATQFPRFLFDTGE